MVRHKIICGKCMADASALGYSEEILLKHVDIMLTSCRHGKIIDLVMSTSTVY